MSAKSPRRITVEEFLDWPGEERSQLIDGEIVAVTPPSVALGILQVSLGRLLENHCWRVGRTSGPPRVQGWCRSSLQDEPADPDRTVTCAAPEAGQRVLPQPVLVVEIMSPSNESETWESVRACGTIPAVRELLVLQSLRIEAHVSRRRTDGTWPDDFDLIAPGQELRLESIGFACRLDEVYARTHLAR